MPVNSSLLTLITSDADIILHNKFFKISDMPLADNPDKNSSVWLKFDVKNLKIFFSTLFLVRPKKFIAIKMNQM